MLSRKEQSTLGKEFPLSWVEEVMNVMKTNFMTNLENDSRTFEVFGYTFPDEILMIFSFADNHRLDIVPVTLFLSVDIDEKTKVKPLLKDLIDAGGTFFDEYFTPNLNEDSFYQATWEEGTHAKLKFFFKISRENVHHSIEATKLLAESGFYSPDDSDEKH